MEAYAVPQREVKVQVQLLDGRELVGTMYAPIADAEGQPGHLIERLNDESIQFVALNDGSAIHLIHATRLLTVTVKEDEEEERVEQEIEQSELSSHLLVKLNLPFGVEVIGHLSYVRPADHSRLQDYLNSAPRFIPVHVQSVLTYVNRDQIITARALRGE